MDFDNFKLQYAIISESRNPNHALHIVCDNGDLVLAQKLIQIYNADPYVYCPDDCTNIYPFIVACLSNNLAIAQWLISTFPLINYRQDNDQAFKDAVYKEYDEIAYWLLTLYTIDTLHHAVNILYQCNDVFELFYSRDCNHLFNWIVEYHGINQLKINNKYQNRFNTFIENYYATIAKCRKTKSAQKC